MPEIVAQVYIWSPVRRYVWLRIKSLTLSAYSDKRDDYFRKPKTDSHERKKRIKIQVSSIKYQVL